MPPSLFFFFFFANSKSLLLISSIWSLLLHRKRLRALVCLSSFSLTMTMIAIILALCMIIGFVLFCFFKKEKGKESRNHLSTLPRWEWTGDRREHTGSTQFCCLPVFNLQTQLLIVGTVNTYTWKVVCCKNSRWCCDWNRSRVKAAMIPTSRELTEGRSTDHGKRYGCFPAIPGFLTILRATLHSFRAFPGSDIVE